MTGQFFWSILPMLGNRTKTKTVTRYHDPVPGRPNKVQPDGPCMRDTLFTEEQLDEIDRRLAIKIREFYGREKKLKEATERFKTRTERTEQDTLEKTRRDSERLATHGRPNQIGGGAGQHTNLAGNHAGHCIRNGGVCPLCSQCPTC